MPFWPPRALQHARRANWLLTALAVLAHLVPPGSMPLSHAPAIRNHPMLVSMAPLSHDLLATPASAALLLAPSNPHHPWHSSRPPGALAHQISLVPTQPPPVLPRQHRGEQPAAILTHSPLSVLRSFELLPLSQGFLHPSGQPTVYQSLLRISSSCLLVPIGSARKEEERPEQLHAQGYAVV